MSEQPIAEYTRLNVNLNDETAAALKTYAEKWQVSITESVRRAVAILNFVDTETSAGSKVRITRPDGQQSQLELM